MRSFVVPKPRTGEPLKVRADWIMIADRDRSLRLRVDTGTTWESNDNTNAAHQIKRAVDLMPVLTGALPAFTPKRT